MFVGSGGAMGSMGRQGTMNAPGQQRVGPDVVGSEDPESSAYSQQLRQVLYPITGGVIVARTCAL